MSGVKVKSALLVLSVAFSLCDGQICPQGDVTLTANQCIEPNQLFNSTVSVLPGSTITLTCSIVDTGVSWNSSQFGMSLRVDGGKMTGAESGITFQLGTVSVNPTCSNATATITNIQGSMDGLDLTCLNVVPTLEFSTTVVFDVIDPPPTFSLMAMQFVNEAVVSWIGNGLPVEPCPITNFTITINGSTINSSTVTEAGDSSQCNHSVVNECGSTLEFSVFATNAAGPGQTTTTDLTIFAAPTDLSLCAVKEYDRTFPKRHFLDTTWKIPSEVRVPSDTGLIIEVNSSIMSPPLGASITMHQFENAAIPGMHNIMAYFEGLQNSLCFSTSNNITIPNEFTMLAVSPTSIIGTETAHFNLMLNNSVFQVTTDNTPVELSGGSGMCSITAATLESLNVTCNDLNDETPYNLVVVMSVGGNCLKILINFNTTETSSSTGSSTVLFSGTASIVSSMTTTSMPPVFPTSAGTATSSATSEPTVAADSEVVVGVGVGVGGAVVALVAIIVSMMIVYLYIQKRKRKVRLGLEQEGDNGDGPIALVEKKAKDPNTGEVGPYDVAIDGQEKQVAHQAAPTGDEYAVVEKQPGAGRRAAPSTPQFEAMTYQDPSTIQRQEAPTGDLYALPQKESKETKESAPVYSEVNKQPERMYAELALSKGGDSGVNRQPPTQEGFVMYSEIQPAAGPPARPPKPQESFPEKSLYSEIQQAPPPPSPLAEQDSMIDVPEEESLYEKYH